MRRGDTGDVCLAGFSRVRADRERSTEMIQEQARTPFGTMPDGRLVEQIFLEKGTMSCQILTYGGAVRALTVPDRDGKPVDVALGFDTLEDYRRQDKYLGALIGRYGNRIGGASFTLNGKEYPLAANDGANHLHGGLQGFDKQIWTVEEQTGDTLALSLQSPDGQEGYPGNLSVRVTYTLTGAGLSIDYWARCDRDTLCSLTNHTYFNLSGHQSGPVTGQYIQLLASRYTPTASGSIPTGELALVEGTPMDLRAGLPIGARVDEAFGQLTMAGGYDHNWCLDGADGTLRLAARAWSRETGITMETWTTQPGVQFYAGNYLDGCPAGKGGAPYGRRWGFCLETQHYPDSPHHPNFPGTVLPAGAEYREKTEYRFSAV